MTYHGDTDSGPEIDHIRRLALTLKLGTSGQGAFEADFRSAHSGTVLLTQTSTTNGFLGSNLSKNKFFRVPGSYAIIKQR